MLEVVETPSAEKALDRLLDEDARLALTFRLAVLPEAGDLIRGGGGLRKMRWASSGKGKSGGIRVIHFTVKNERVYIVAAFAKSDRGNLTQAELKELRALLRSIGS